MNLILDSGIMKNWHLDTYSPFYTSLKHWDEKPWVTSDVAINLLGILAADFLDYMKTTWAAVRLPSSWTSSPWERHIFKQRNSVTGLGVYKRVSDGQWLLVKQFWFQQASQTNRAVCGKVHHWVAIQNSSVTKPTTYCCTKPLCYFKTEILFTDLWIPSA